MLAKKAIWAGLCLGSICSSMASAQVLSGRPPARGQDDAQSFTISGRGEARHVENALQRAGEDQIAEQQYTGSLLLAGQVNNGWAFFSSDYNLTTRHYTEQEVRNDTLLLGNSSLQLGRDTQRLYLTLEHSTQEIVEDPLLGDVPGNRDTRTLLGATLNSTLRLRYGDAIRLWANQTQIQFDENTLNEAQRQGAGFGYTRAISPLYNAGFNVSAYELDYRYVDQMVRNLRGYLWWKADLRYLDYKINLGYDQFKTQDDDTVSSPYLDTSISYDEGLHVFSLAYRQWLSETSQGSLNSQEFDREVGQDGRVDIVDQFLRQDLIFSWLNRRPCMTCSLSVNIGIENEDYYNQVQYSSRESFLRANFSYQFNRRMALSLSSSYNYVDFYEDESRSDFNETRAAIGLDFLNLFRNGEMSVFVGGLNREFEEDDGYHTEYVGLSFGYKFYEFRGK